MRALIKGNRGNWPMKETESLTDTKFTGSSVMDFLVSSSKGHSQKLPLYGISL